MDYDHDDEIQYFIEYVGLLGAPKTITFDLTLLTGGKTGTNPIASATVVRPFSPTRPLYSPIPIDFLVMASETPNLRLTVNSIPAVCDNCVYEIN